MTREETAKRVVRVTACELNMNAADNRESEIFVTEPGADSLKSIELVAAFEEEFGISVVEEEALKVQSVGAAIDFFDKRINKHQEGSTA